MNSFWRPAPISEGTLPALRQPVFLKTWEGAPGRDNARQQATYLDKPGCVLFTTGGVILPKQAFYGVGQKYGQQRIVLSPLNTDGIDEIAYADRLADLWGLTEHGWYGVFHTDRTHHHFHIIAETEAADGSRVVLDDAALRTWALHAQRLSTHILGLYRNPGRAAVRAWEQDNDFVDTWEFANAA